MPSKKKKVGGKIRGLEAISESSESRPTEKASSSISSPRSFPAATAPSTSANPSPHSSTQLPSAALSSDPSSKPRSSTQAPSRPVLGALPHRLASAKPASSPCSSESQASSAAARASVTCTGPCCSGSKSSSSSRHSHPSRPKGTRSVSPNPLLPSIPPPTRRPKTMGKKKSKSSSSRQKAKTASESKDKSVDAQSDQNPVAQSEWNPQAYPVALRPLFEDTAPEVAKYIYEERAQLYLLMQKLINEAKDGYSPVHIVILKPVPVDVLQDGAVWNYNIAPHCRYLYLMEQQTLMLQIAKETRLMESLNKNELYFDDSDMGVQGHALGRLQYGLKKQFSAMGIPDTRWDLMCCEFRQSRGLLSNNANAPSTKAIHSVDRMFIPGIIRHPKWDVKHEPWPSMVVECATDYANRATRAYLEFCVDWWFGESQGFTKYALLMYFNYELFETIVEKWTCATEAPYTKQLVQTVKINLEPDAIGKATVVVHGEDIVLDFQSLMARPKRQGESDIIIDKALMNGFGNGYLVPWPNLGNDRVKNLKRSGIDVATARELLNYPLAVLKQQLAPALAEGLKKVENNAKETGSEADIRKSRVTLTLSRTRMDTGGEDRIPVDLSIEEAIAIMAEKEKEEVEEKK